MLIMLLTLGVGQMWGAWIGNSGIQVNGTWYKCSSNINSGHWLESYNSFASANLGAITELELGGQYDSWDNSQTDYCSWNSNNGIGITIKLGDTQIDNFKLSCFNSGKDGNNNVWKTYGTTADCSDDNEGWDTYIVDISEYAAGNYTLKASWTSPSSQSLNNTANFTINPVVTFKANGGTGSDYTQTVTYNSSTALTACTFTRSGYAFAGWATSSGGSVVYADGGNVTLTAHTDLYAKWVAEETHDVTVSYKCSTATIKDATTESGVGVTSARNVTAPDIEGYTFSSWTVGNGITNNTGSTSAKTININTKGSGSYTLTANYTAKACELYKFTASKTTTEAGTNVGVMTFDASTKAYYIDITTNASPYYFRFNFNSGTYYSTNWAAGGYSSGKTVTANGSKVDCDQSVGGWDDKPSIVFNGLNSSAIRIWFDYQAKKVWITETQYSVTINDGDHGTVDPHGSQSAGKNSGVEIEAEPNTGWKFVSWGKTGSAVLSSTSTNPTTVTATAAGGTVTPTYAHRFILRGSTVASDVTTAGMAGWSANDNSSYTSATISEGVMTITANLTAASTQYKFLIRDLVNDSYKGQTGTGEMSDGDTWTLNGTNDVKFTTTIAGTYTFTYNCSTGSMTIGYPTTYTLNYALGTVPGTTGSISSSPSTASGTKIASGETITLTAPDEKTGYDWAGWYLNSDGSGVQQCSTKAYAITMGDDVEVYACYTEKKYSTTIQNDGNGTTTPSSSFDVYHHTGSSITANPGEYFAFDRWTIANGGLAFKSPKTASTNPTTVTATGTGGTIKAYFKNRWVVAGGDSGSGDGADDLGDWSTSTNEMTYTTGTSVSKTITINTPGDYKLKIKDRREDADHGWSGKNSTTITRASSSASGLSTSGANITFTADVAGTYVFTFDASAKSLSVKYPAKISWSANSIYSGSATIAASVTGVTSGNSLKYELFNGTDMSVDAAQTINVTTSSTSHAQNITVTPSFGSSDINKIYTVKITYDGQYAYYTHVVGRKWDIYVHDVQSWGGVKLHHWGDYGSSDYPGSACSQYKSPSTWYTVTIDGKYNTGFVLSKSSDDTKKTVDLTPSITTYPAGSYWYISYADSKYGLTTAGTVVAPTVTLTVDKVNVNQITVTGTVTNCGGDGTTAADMKEVGFYLGETKYTATYKSGTSFKKTITSLTDNTEYSAKAFATNIIGTSYSEAEDVTTLEDADYRVKVRVDHGDAAPKVYAWTNADSYGGSSMENGTYKSQEAAETLFEASTYDWYYCDLNNKYENFLIYTTGDDNKSQDFAATRTSDCYWYDASASAGSRAARMDCPIMTTNLYFGDKDAAAGDHVYHEMSGTTTMTKTLSLAANEHYEFKIVYNTEFYGIDSKTINRDGKTNNVINAGTAVVNGAYIYLNTDFAGDYTFTFNESTKAVSVKYPNAYVMTYSYSIVGTDNSTTTDPSAETSEDLAVSSGDLVLDGTTLTFTAAAAATGYTWKGWYTVADPSADYAQNLLEDEADYTITIDDETTIYAVYAEDKYDVTVAKDATGGSISTTSVSGVGISTASETITATPTNNAWRFWYWEIPDGVSLASGTTTSTSITIHATAADKTITAHFQPRYALVGSLVAGDVPAGMPGWDAGTAPDFSVISFTALGSGDGKGVDLECSRTLEPNKQYKFEIHDRSKGKNIGPQYHQSTMEANQNWQLRYQDHDVYFYTAGYGTYTFHITNISDDDNYWPSVQIDRPDADEVTIGQLSSYNEGADSDATTTGGNVTAKTTENDPESGDATDYAITNGQYIRSGGTAVFTAHPETGYTFAGWYSDASCETAITHNGTTIVIDNVNKTLTLSNITEAKSVYAKFTENMTTVKIRSNKEVYGNSVTAGANTINNTYDNPHGWGKQGYKVGVHTGLALTANPGTAYYFSDWTIPDGADFELRNNDGDEDRTVNLYGLGDGESDQTLTVNFEKLEEIYFENRSGSSLDKLWNVDAIYAYFNVSWIDGSGYGEYPGVGNTTRENIVTIQLTPVIEGSTTYMGYVPRSVTKAQGNTTINIAFSDSWMGDNTYPDKAWRKFSGGKGVFRTDYNKKLNMYVPYHVKSGTSNTTDYYDTGFWKVAYVKKDESIGYYIKDNNNTEKNLGEFKGIQDYRSVGEAIARIDYTDTRKLYIVSAGGEYYKLVDDPTVTYLACSNLTMEKDGSKAGFNLTPSTEGYYTFRIEMYGDQMKLYVDYPVGPGDYRLEHTYNSGANKTHSDVIKNTKAETQKRYSMYLNTTGSPTLKLQECTSINKTTLQPVWADVTNATANLSAITYALSENGSGVYQFDLSIDTTNDVVRAGSVDSVRLYTGPYYIKTDCAPGSWANYKNNAMTLNTINYKKTDPNTFDYYFCSWIGDAGTNIKCVIANDHSTQLSDTLIDDAILGSGVQTMPYAGNVRFSYNSYTNDIKRAYLNGSSNYHDKFLWVEGYNSKVDADPSTDGVQTNNKLTDKGNWTYMLDIQAQETARARLTAKFGNNDASGKVQSLIGDKDGDLSASNTVEILGGSSSSVTWNDIRLIYDFKTNHLMSAWLVPSGEDSESKAINTDILILRENQDPARQITFASASDKLTEVDTVYAALCITKSHMTDITGERPADVYARRAFYWVSFPFDVKISDIFGSAGTFGEDWIMQTYNGKRRAEKGYWIDSESNWDFMNFTDTLKAGHGYVVTLDIGEFAEYSNKWANSVNEVYLYFPSISRVGTIDQENRSINLGNPSDYECNISRNSRNVYDSYWHCIGAPSFAENTRLANDPRPSWYDADPEHGIQQGELPDSISHWTTNLLFVYEYDAAYDYLQPRFYGAGKQDFTFKPMYSYLVQYKQEYIDWTNVVTPKQSIVARRARQTNEISDITFRLELTNGTKMLDQAFVLMSDDEAITNNYDFNYDLAKESNSGRANLWTLTADTIKAAANCLPLSEQTTIIPVGVQTTAAGDYTFTIPNGTNGVGIVLIDNIAGTRTNLSLTDYTVNLAKGTIDGRFMLEISPIAQTPTGMQNTGAGVQDDVRKVVVDGILYIVKDGVVYDAQGKRVQ